MLKRLIYKWELKLASRDNNRVVRPFEWGLDHLNGAFEPESFVHKSDFRFPGDENDSRRIMFGFNEAAISNSEEFFCLKSLPEFDFDGHWLSFRSPVQTPYPENNIGYARFFPVNRSGKNGSPASGREAESASGRAVLVLPQWNADIEGHVALCRLLNKVGIATLRLSLPYHDRRMLQGFERADYLVSSNLGRTLQGCNQAVLDCRAAISWLERRGYERIGIMGTSIGSCISFLTFVHDKRIKTGVFNHVSSYFGDVVWVGMTTAHVRKGLETELLQEEVRKAWAAISPNSYVHRLADDTRPGLMISGRYDPSFTPELSQLLFDECRRWEAPISKRLIPCGHYTLGEFPFKYYDAYLIANFFRKHL